MTTQVWPSASFVTCSRTLLMSVLDEALLVVQTQVVGSSNHFWPPVNTLSFPLNGSMKWNVVNGFNGAPAEFRSWSQSPVLASGARLPSMANPPESESTGATPAGGPAARADKRHKAKTASNA